MMSGGAVLWRAMVHFWDESLLLIRTNLTWFVTIIPLYLVTVVAIIVVNGLAQWFGGAAIDAEAEASSLPWILAAFMLVVLPSPPSAGVYTIAMYIVHGETPEFSVFWQSLRRWWKRTLMLYLIGAALLGGLIFNTIFYMSITTGMLQAISVLWVYAIIFWLTLQAYLLPLLVQSVVPPPTSTTDDDGWPLDEERRAERARTRAKAPEPSPSPIVEPALMDLYKRAAILALANPIFSLVLFFGVVITLALSTFAMPVYPLLAMSFVALIHTRGYRVLYDKYASTEARGAPR
jgi:uncharacterized membrane protein YesL